MLGSDRFSPDEATYTCDLLRRDRVAEIVLGGELDLAARPQLDAALHSLLDAGGTDTVVLDLTAVRFLDSTILMWLVLAQRCVYGTGAELSIVTERGALSDLLQLTGIDKHLGVKERQADDGHKGRRAPD
jgi:anti-anti-sigma factor